MKVPGWCRNDESGPHHEDVSGHRRGAAKDRHREAAGCGDPSASLGARWCVGRITAAFGLSMSRSRLFTIGVRCQA